MHCIAFHLHLNMYVPFVLGKSKLFRGYSTVTYKPTQLESPSSPAILIASRNSLTFISALFSQSEVWISI